MIYWRQPSARSSAGSNTNTMWGNLGRGSPLGCCAPVGALTRKCKARANSISGNHATGCRYEECQRVLIASQQLQHWGKMTENSNHILALLLLVFAVYCAGTAVIYGRPSRTVCNALTQKRGKQARGRCQHSVTTSNRCSAGHDTSWVGRGYFYGFIAVAACIFVLIAKPLGLSG